MVTSSPFPTCSSPSQLVSIDAGLKSSEEDGQPLDGNHEDNIQTKKTNPPAQQKNQKLKMSFPHIFFNV